MPGQHEDGGTEAHLRRLRGEIGQEIQRRRDLTETGEVMLDEEDAVKAELFGCEDVMDVAAVVRAVARLLAGIGPRAPEQSEPHAILHPNKPLSRIAGRG